MLRLIEIYLPEGSEKELPDLIKEQSALGVWLDHLSENKILIKVLLPSEKTEPILDLLEKRYSDSEGFRVILLPVEASIPRPAPEEEKPADASEALAEEKPAPQPERISREELYSDINETIKLSRVFIIMVVLSAIVAAIGLMRSNIAIIIGAMVIAPLLGPNVALSLATTLGDMDLARRAAKTNAVGIAIALVFAAVVGLVFQVDPNTPEIQSRTMVGIGDIILALASGSAAALSFTTGLSSALIGVMVAVALLPPLVTFGMLLGIGYWQGALGALLLLLTNVICVNLAGVTTFILQGIRPRSWWEAAKAKKATRIAVVLWIALLVLLTAVILLSQRT